MTRYSSLILTCTLALASACGDDPSGPGGDGTLTATVNGSSFSSQFPPTAFITDGDLYIDATQASGSGYRSISISLASVTHTGTYTFGPAENFAVYGEGSLQLGDSKLWFTNPEVPSGQVVITELTSSRVVGTFNFVAEPFLGDAVGAKTVTNGAFSVLLTGS